MLLRPTQSKALADVQDAYRRGKRKPLLCAHTAFGKSTLVGSMLTRTKKSVLYLCPQEGLMERVIEDLNRAGIRHGVIHGSKGALPNTYRVHVSMPKTIANRLDRLPHFEWVISDEAHLSMSATWASVLAHYDTSWHLGMSATPCRLDGRPLGKYFDEIVYGPSIRESTDRGYLSPVRVFAPPPDFESGGTASLSLDSAAGMLNTRTITGSAIAEMRKRAPDRQALVFTCNRKHSEDVAQQFRNEGISAIAVDSTMADRKERFRDFENKRAQVLVNVELATTGYDYPPVDLEILLRDTDSVSLALQIWGRVVRTSLSTGKSDALIHDHVGMILRHGMPDADREWTLDGREKRSSAPAVRQCMSCYAVFAPAPKCPSCGYTIPVASKPRAVVQRSGELEEIKEAEVSARRQADIKAALKSARTLADFQNVARQFGNKSAWAFHMFQIYSKYRKGRAA